LGERRQARGRNRPDLLLEVCFGARTITIFAEQFCVRQTEQTYQCAAPHELRTGADQGSLNPESTMIKWK
jgi:hypothetical protein